MDSIEGYTMYCMWIQIENFTKMILRVPENVIYTIVFSPLQCFIVGSTCLIYITLEELNEASRRQLNWLQL